MTNTEIDRKLALAIGYLPEDITVARFGTYVRRGDTGGHGYYIFSHQDPAVILPIMERYNVYPFKFNGEWIAVAFGDRSTVSAKLSEAKHTNPRTATAMAVIKAKEMGLI